MKNWTLRGGYPNERDGRLKPSARRAVRQIRRHGREFQGAGMTSDEAWIIGVVAEHMSRLNAAAERLALIFVGGPTCPKCRLVFEACTCTEGAS